VRLDPLHFGALLMAVYGHVLIAERPTRNEKPTHAVPVSGSGLLALTTAPRSREIITGGFDRIVSVYSMRMKRIRWQSEDLGGPVRSIALSPSEKWIAVTPGFELIRFIHPGRRVTTFDVEIADTRITGLAFSPEGDFLLCSCDDGTIQLISLPMRKLVEKHQIHQASIASMSISKDGTVCVGGIDGVMKTWSLPQRRTTSTFQVGRRSIEIACITPDGSSVLTSDGSDQFAIWNVSAKKPAARLTHHKKAINALAFNDTGTSFASGGEDNTLCLWHLSDLARPYKIITLPRAIQNIVYFPGGQSIAISTGSYHRETAGFLYLYTTADK